MLSAIVASAVVVFASAAAAQTKPLPDPTQPPATPVIVIDLARGADTARAAARDALAEALKKNGRLSADDDDDLEAALSGAVASGALRRGKAASKSATGAATCGEATTSASLAILDLAAAQASGEAVTGELLATYGVSFRCAIETGDANTALHLAQSLRRLGKSDPPDGVDAATWALYPELDGAANVGLSSVTIESSPAGATVWIDHKKRGVAPLTLQLSQGAHIVAVASEAGVAAKIIEISSWTHTESLAPTPAVGRWSGVATAVAALRAGRQAADGKAIAEVMSLAGTDLAFVILSGGTFEAWQAKQAGGARRLGQRHDAKQIVELVATSLAGSRAPDPNGQLLRETAAERAARARRDGAETDDKPAKWWVYAAVLGATAIGAGIIVFGQSGDDVQRFEITLP